MDDLRVCALQLKSLGVGEEYQNIKKTSTEGLRITIVKPDGTVKFDNFMDASELSNHSERPEIKEALKKGEGQDIRTSETLNKSTFYYAVLLKDGNVLRISKEAGNVWNIVFYAMPFIMGMSVAILILTVVISHYLTKSIVKPIEQAAQDLEHLERIQTYEEIEPFIEMIQAQHRDIVQNVQVRQEFTANVSHELKTPIALIQGYAEGLQDNINDDQESREFYCEVIIDEANKMNKMVKKLLTLNQIEFGSDQVHFERFDIVQVLRSSVNSATLLAEQKDAEILFYETDPVYVWADEYMIEEVITNYISNAVNHVDGERVIRVTMERRGDVERISVFNTGKTIPEEDLDKIWVKFYKVDKARTRAYGGNGIGLSIVKAIMDSMNQKCGVINHENGVEFWFELDCKTID